MKILVIDDSTANQKSAELLKGDGHEVEIIGTVKSAYERLQRGEFDLLLTDLMMPLDSFNGELAGNIDRGDEHPVGLIFAAKAANFGIPSVICTDSNHHNDPVCALLDLLGSSEPNQNIMFVEARGARLTSAPYHYVKLEDDKWVDAEFEDKIVKDWRKVMENLFMRHPNNYPSLFVEI